jgi:glycosyltransferase involved in cell wall biosynthesis
MEQTISPGFSIVLCTHNGKSRLRPTLSHIAGLRLPRGYNIELLLIDNASTDGTTLFAQQEWAALGNPFSLRLLTESRSGKGYAVETGYDAAAYSYILTVDDDNWLNADYLEKAIMLFSMDPCIGVLQGLSIAEFEVAAPEWIKKDSLENFLVIGSPIGKTGYFPINNFGVWGAGMIIYKKDWLYLRSIGFSFLTSKLPGKAAGEDHELGMALLMMGKKIYYSDELKFKHFMPASRIQWKSLQRNFETFGYVSYYNFLYKISLEGLENNSELTHSLLIRKFRKMFWHAVKGITLKQHIAYWLLPKKEYYQLRMRQYKALYKTFRELNRNAMNDIAFLQGWMAPLMKKHPGSFKFP